MADELETHPDNSPKAEKAVRNLVQSLDDNELAESDAHFLMNELEEYVEQFTAEVKHDE